ncbi:MAG: IPT/TIG domain-containing protein [Patescibacteria group bacterium]|nr:IPT/TIG domain-containing protein [Patescibacteria group bacterium]
MKIQKLLSLLMLKKYKILISLIAALITLSVGSFAMAQTDLGLNSAANLGLQDGGGDARDLIIRIVQYLLTFVGIIATVVVLYGGFLWMTAGGRAEQIRKAKQALVSGIVGVIIILSAFVIVTFIVNLTQDSLSPTCDAICGPGTKCCNGSPDYCIANANICCVAEGPAGFCLPGEYCCAGGCQATPCFGGGVGLSFSVTDTIPDDGQSGVIRNVRLIFNFNKTINSATVDAASFEVLDSGGLVISGDIAVSGNKIIFQPDTGTCPVNECDADRCFADSENVIVRAHTAIESTSGDSLEWIYPVTGPPIACNAANPCEITFDVGSEIDCDDPTVGLDFDQICAGPGNTVIVTASDGSGVADVLLAINDGTSDIYNNSANASGALTFSNIFNFDGSTYPATVIVTATANDIDSHSASRSETATVRPGHCCNRLLDELLGEFGVDCGGPCAACDGAACGISLNDDCDDAGIACHARDDVCSSRYCDCTAMGGAECQDAGYIAGIDDCCICQQQPIIDWITPMGGFCRDGVTLTNTACLSDQYCIDNEVTAHTCDRDTANAARLNLITIYGRNFGDDPGTGGVTIGGQNASLASVISGCTSDYWTNTAITVQVPNTVDDVGFPDLEVIITTNNGYFDSNQDLPAEEPVFEFIINTISRPGLCDINPVSGPPETTNITYFGMQLNLANAYFGNIFSPIEALNSALNTQATVPQLNPGVISTFAIDAQTYSNYLDFTVEEVTSPGPEIISFDPINGAPGTYVTIHGSGFGDTRGEVISDVYFGAVGSDEAEYDFPAICDGGIWNDGQVIVKVPTALSNGDVRVISMDVIDVAVSDIDTGSDVFTVNDLLRPSLCSLVPLAQDLGQEITLAGEYFGPDANRTVRFHPGTDNTIIAANNQDTTDYNQVVATTTLDALTGPVRMVRNDSGLDIEGNSMNLTIGTCLDAPVPDDACVGSDVCCAPGTFREGQCQTNTDACNLEAGAAVYEWDFSTRAEGGDIGDPCSDSDLTTCNDALPECQNGLICDENNSCTCQMSCDTNPATPAVCDMALDICASIPGDYVCSPDDGCICVEAVPGDSCQGRAEQTGECAPEFCPNSAGYCSPNDDTDANQGSCDFDCGGASGYENINDRCEINNTEIDCVGNFTDASNNPIKAECQEYPSGSEDYYWQYFTTASCPTNWTKIPGNICISTSSIASITCSETTEICPVGFTCNKTNENCVADNEICPGRADCTTADRCILENNDICECCCEVGFDARDCCSPLTCAGSCGEGTIDRDGDGSPDDTNSDGTNDRLGYCTGCADAGTTVVDHDVACNCFGHSDKFCDETVGDDLDNDGNPDGICVDCGQLSRDECMTESGCCLDAMNSDVCRGTIINNIGDGEKMASGSCAYYDCTAPYSNGTVACASTTMLLSGIHDNLTTCTTTCPLSGGLLPGFDCYNITEDDCNLLCAGSAYDCMGTANPPPNDDCLCCCDVNVIDECPESLDCQEADPCENDDRGLCCGCTDDASCGTLTLIGCGTDSCCRGRPNVNSTIPSDDDDDICHNAAISVTFDKVMDPGSMINNFYLVGEYVGACPDNTQYLVYNNDSRRENKNFFVQMKNKFIFGFTKIWNNIWGSDSAIAYVAPQSIYNYCAVPGSINSEIISGKTTVTFFPQILLDPDRSYYAIVKGDKDLDSSEGVLDRWGIGMNASGISPSGNATTNITFNGIEYTNSYIWNFTTLEATDGSGVCTVDRVDLQPQSYLFQTVVDDVGENDDNPDDDESFDTENDSDKAFGVKVYSENNQILAPIPNTYDWNWTWTIDDTDVVYFSADPNADWPILGDKRLVEVVDTVVDDNTYVRAVLNIIDNDYSLGGNGTRDASQVYVFICQNPWPPIDANTGEWSPWTDGGGNCTFDNNDNNDDDCANTNFAMYYCRDAGEPGTFDDLPIIGFASGGEQVIRERDGDILKEVFFPRGVIPSATTTVTVNSIDTGSTVEVKWNEIVSVASYRLYWGMNSGTYDDFATIQNSGAYASDNEQVSCSEDANVITCTVNELENNNIYYFTLSSVNANQAESGFYNEEMVLVEDIAGLVAPTNLVATSTDSQVELEWDEVVGASGYRVYFKGGTGCNNVVDFPPDCYAESYDADTDLGVNLSGFSNGIIYYFAVTTYDEYGNEEVYSSEVEVHPFETPNNLSVSAISDTEIELNWVLTSEGVVNTNIYWGDTISGDYLLDSDSENEVIDTYTIDNLSSTTAYYIIIASENSQGEENFSNEVVQEAWNN